MSSATLPATQTPLKLLDRVRWTRKGFAHAPVPATSNRCSRGSHPRGPSRHMSARHLGASGAFALALFAATAPHIRGDSAVAAMRPTQSRNRVLTFADRVVFQKAIETVYWRHRIWP